MMSEELGYKKSPVLSVQGFLYKEDNWVYFFSSVRVNGLVLAKSTRIGAATKIEE